MNEFTNAGGDGQVQGCIDQNYIDDVKQIAQAYRERPDQIVDILHKVQALRNYLPPEAMAAVAKVLDLPESQVYSVATFYSMFSVVPRGRHIIRVCESPPCHVMGSERMLDVVSRFLNVEPGRTTSDGRFTLETTSCLGVCGVAPAMMIDDDVHGNLSPGDVPGILARYQ